MKERLLLITKDALCKDYLPVYGNMIWKGKTPNIDELAEKGTVFQHYYTAAPSTVMAFRSMMTGKFAHETPYSDYIPMEISQTEQDFFNVATKLGYQNHLIWPKGWDRMVLRYGNCFGDNLCIHDLMRMNQGVGPHRKSTEPLKNNDSLFYEALEELENEVRTIIETDEKVFLWIHFPHVIKGRTGYGGDMDIFDKCVGMLRKYFEDDSIFLSADHGNMDGHRGKFSYGFDVYTPAIEIPLITPRIEEKKIWKEQVSNVDIKKIIFERKIPSREFIFSDCAYYAQPHRKLAIIRDEFLYIYNKKDRSEELYDISYDKYQRCNLLKETFFDTDRKLNTITKEVYFSPRWDEVNKYYQIFRAEKERMWKNAPLFVEIRGRLLAFLKKIYVKISIKLRRIVKKR